MKSNFQKSIAIGAALFSSLVFASPCYVYDNFYLGANIGITSLSDNESTDIPIKDSHDLSASGIVGGALFGYDFTLKDQWKLGLEAFLNATDVNLADNQDYAPVSSYTVNMRYNLGFRLLPGYELTPGTVAHAIIGYSYAKFDINDNGNYGIISTDFKKSGLQLGLGMTTAVFKNISLRGDVIYTTYSSQSSNGITTSTPATTQTYHNNPTTLEGNLVLVYKFS